MTADSPASNEHDAPTLEYVCLIGVLPSNCIKGVLLRLACEHPQAALVALRDAFVPACACRKDIQIVET